jgi:tetratricopeptide (TPR) repeat protein
VQSLRAYIRGIEPDSLRDQLGPHGGEVAHVLPELREAVPDLPVLQSPESEGARFRVFDATATFLKRAAEAKPLVLVLEDLHAADASSLLLLEFIAREVADARILMVGTYRDIELGPGHPLAGALVELNRQRSTRTLLLQGVRERDVSRLIEISAGVAPPPRVSVAIHRATGGNPLFVGELARLLAAEGRLAEPVDEADLRLAIPQGVRDVIGRRLARVSSRCREVLGMASVLGREFTVTALAHVTEPERAAVVGLLDEAISQRVVAEAPGGGGRVRFSHVLIRDALYYELGASWRMQLHRQIGDALETLYADDLDRHLAELAYHFFEASPQGDAGKAYDYARRAGDRAARLLAYEEAVRLYKRAVQVIEAGAPMEDLRHCETLLALGDAQLRAGDEEGAKETFLGAADLARRLNAPERLAHAALGYGGRYWMAARGDRAVIPLLEEALSSLEEGDSTLRARLMARLSCAIRDQPFRERRGQLSEDAVEMARRVGDSRTLAYALAARCVALPGPDTLDQFGEAAADAVRFGQRVSDPEAELTGRWWRILFELQLGNTAGARQELATATRLADKTREPAYRWYPAGLTAALALFEGRFGDAADLIARAYELGRTALTFNTICTYRLQMFVLHKQRGEPPYDEEVLERLVAEHETYTILRCARCNLLLDQGRGADARRIFDELAAHGFEQVYLDEEWLAGMTLLAEACWAIGDATHASDLYDQLSPYAHLNAVAFPEMVLGSVERPLGILAGMMGRTEESERHFERALEMNTEMGARPWVAHTQHDYGRMLTSHGGAGYRDRAVELLSAALRGHRELGMKPWQARAEAELDALG